MPAAKHSMLTLILVLVTLISNSIHAQQLEVVLNNTSKAYRLELYSWFPTKDNTSAISTAINKGKATLVLDTFKEGVYTLYAIDQRGIGKAPFIDVIIAKHESPQLYWDTNSGWYQFQNSEVNTMLQNNRYCNNEIFKEEQFYKAQLLNENNKKQSKNYQYQLNYLEVQKRKLYKSIKQSKHPWDDYLIYNDAYNNADLNLETFWDAFPVNNQYIYHTPFVSNVIGLLRKLLTKKYRSQAQLVEELLVEQLVKNIGATEEGLSYLENWLYANYNTNQSNTVFVKGLQLLAKKLPDNQSIAKDLKHYEPLISGELIMLKELDEQFLLTKDLKPHTLIFMSNNCGYCHDLLNSINNTNNKQPVLAISVLNDSEETKAKLKTQYNNIAFAFPENGKALKDIYASRGTPSLFTVYKQNGKWFIQ